eukprot:TRINITY_DN5650_c1_g1_i1.p2 TRINITY_DN5650_c1_g1~~TRINITY_DN5650_c1_g1_i1.p2  ORF type:complete len:108 (-),score=13.80 TRINITY_DN5650_c1_g1_i1:442-765(-)
MGMCQFLTRGLTAPAAQQCWKQAGNHVCAVLFHLGILYSQDKDRSVEATNAHRHAAEQGYADAQVVCGNRYRSGRYVDKDLNEARRWYGLAALQGNQSAIRNLKEIP